MPFPTQTALEVPLLQVLLELGGEAAPADIYPRLAAKYPHLTPQELEARMPSGNVHWWNHVQWVRQHLKQRGELDGSIPGVWKLTPLGQARLDRERGVPQTTDAQPVQSPELHPILIDELTRLHSTLLTKGDLRSNETLKGLFALFRQRFGPEVLRAHDGEPLLSLIHETTRDGLVYWLEFKDDDEFPAIFGSIAGGSALKYGLYRRKDSGAWMTGTPTAQIELSTAEAISIARRNRDQLVAASEVLAAFPTESDDAAYVRLQADLRRVAPDVEDSSWGHKYLSLLYPEKLDDYHAVAYQRFHLIKLLQQPAEIEGRYVNAGRFLGLARAFGWPANHLTTLLNRRDGSPHRYWRIGTSAGDTGESHWAEMRDASAVAIGWSKLGDLSREIGGNDFKEIVRARGTDSYPADPRVEGRRAQQIAHFCQTILERDYVLACDGARVLGIGRVTGPYFFDSAHAFPHLRPVQWLDLSEWQLPTTEGLRTTVHEFRKHADNLIAIERRVLESSNQAPVAPAARPASTTTTGALQWPHADLVGRIQDVLNRKGQIILYGPPGTGKSYWAERAAKNLAALWNFGKSLDQLSDTDVARLTENGTESFVRLCSFHPAYGYEDFIEGFRPTSADGNLNFVRKNGIFKNLCAKAEQNPKKRFYLIIDEINRGDIPRIFGELLTLVEKSKRGLTAVLPLSGDEFSVPPNVFLIGTMNTADRSIALLDTALRRRFGFIELLPDATTLGDTVIEGIPLGPWLTALNRLITNNVGRDGRNLQVGHSYFLSNERPIQDFPQLSRVLQEDIFPLLEEYCYDDWTTLERILGPAIVDVSDRRLKVELFAPQRQVEFVQALLSCTPEVNSSEVALAAEAAVESNEPDAEDEEEGA